MSKVKSFSTDRDVIFVRYLCDDGQYHDFYFDPCHTSISFDSNIGFRFDCTVWEKGMPIDKIYHFYFSRIRNFVFNNLDLDSKYDEVNF